jgi:SAM-dependent methyltransferase
MTGASEPPTPSTETDASVLHEAMLRRLPECVAVTAQVNVPPIPALLDHYVRLFDGLWTAVGRSCSAEELETFKGVLQTKLQGAWNASQYSKITVSYATDVAPNPGLKWNVTVVLSSLSDVYENWAQTREAPHFGTHPDAKVLSLARSLGKPAQVPILDIGAGPGRNTLPLAREGFPTDAIEVAPTFAAMLREEAKAARLPVRVFEGNLFDTSIGVPVSRYRMLVLAEVASHFRNVASFRALFQRAAKLLKSGGLLVFSAFLADDGYEPDAIARQLSQVRWCSLFTRGDLAEGLADEPFELVSDESAAAFEKANLPASHWPPTGWFETWSSGLDIFDLPAGKSACQLRWLVYRRTG